MHLIAIQLMFCYFILFYSDFVLQFEIKINITNNNTELYVCMCLAIYTVHCYNSRYNKIKVDLYDEKDLQI